MVLLTGATGLLGSHFALWLLKAGYKVKAVMRENSDLQTIKKIFSFYEPELGHEYFQKIEWVKGSLNDVFFIEESLENCNIVIHAAAIVSFDADNKKEITNANVSLTENIANAAQEKEIDCFVHISSTAALGSKLKETDFITEDDVLKPDFDTNVYSLSKFLAEMEVWRAFNEGLNGFILNPSVIIGPGDINRSSGTLFRRIIEGFKFYTNGSNAFVDVRDVADALIKLLAIKEKVNKNRFLVIGENLSFKALFDLIADALGKRRPSLEANFFITGFVWRFSKFISFFTGKSPKFTKANAVSAHKKRLYSYNKIASAISYKPRFIKDAVENTVKFINS